MFGPRHEVEPTHRASAAARMSFLRMGWAMIVVREEGKDTLAPLRGPHLVKVSDERGRAGMENGVYSRMSKGGLGGLETAFRGQVPDGPQIC